MENETQVNEEQKRRKPYSFIFLIWQSLLIILVIASLAGVVASFKNNLQLDQKFDREIQEIYQKISSAQESSSTTFSELKTQLQKQEAELALLKTTPKEKASFSRMIQLTEIAELIKLANLNLIYSQHTSVARHLLEMATDDITSLNQSDLFPLQRKITTHLLQLEKISENQQASLDKISQLISRIPTLSTVTYAEPNTPVKTPTSRAWKALEKIIIIQRLDESAVPLLPKQRDVIEQTLHLFLQQATSAILQKDQTLYNESLKQAENILEKYFNKNSPDTKSFMKDLSELQQTNIKPSLPNLNDVLTLSEKLINKK